MTKKLTALLLVSCMFLQSQLYAQSPQKLSYQAVIRDNQNHLVTDHIIGIRLSILQGSTTGAVKYTETQTPSTNTNGLISIEIGGGAGFSAIDWSTGPYFLNTETDPAGGTSYTISGTSQLLSVPFALYSKSAGSYNETDPLFTSSPSNGIAGSDITNWNTAFNWGNHAVSGYVPGTRTLTVNGTAYNLTANVSWNVGTVTSIGLILPGIFSVIGSPVTASGTLGANLIPQNANFVFVSPDGSNGVPSFRALVPNDIPGLDWNKIITGKPTTLAGYGITDGVTTTGNQTIGGNKTFTGTTTVPTPVNSMDAVTKAYVDALLSQIQTLQMQPGVAKDVDGNLYTTIKIGGQVWLGENLKTTSYNDGTSIPLVTNNTTWLNLTTPGYCWYNNDAATNKITYGALYNWYAVSTTTNGNKNICPTGWHMPTDAEWTNMENYLIANAFNYDGTTTGNKIAKSLASSAFWQSSPAPGAVGNTDYPNKRNATGFTALPAGYRAANDGAFHDIGLLDFWWTDTEYDINIARTLALTCSGTSLERNSAFKVAGLSVRCLKD